MILLPNNCKCTEPFVHPKDWQTSPKTVKEIKALLNEDWYITYRFYDAEGKTKQITKRKMRKYGTLSDRQDAVRTALKTIKDMLIIEGYNPITGIASIPVDSDYEIHPRTELCRALKQALARLTLEPKTRQDIRNILPHVEKASGLAICKDMPVSEVKRRHIIKIFDQLKIIKPKWGPSLHNQYRKYLKILFTELIRLQTIETNPIDEYFKKEKTVKKIRLTLTPEERNRVKAALQSNPSFWRYLNIFYQSGARTTELLKLKGKDVYLDNQYIKIIIKKGDQPREVMKIIKDVALPYWNEVMKDCKAEDYVFARGLKPGAVAINPDQISKRWYRLIKKKLNIKADFYSNKHLAADEISRLLNIQAAKEHMDHTTLTTTKIYTVGEAKREDDKLKKLNNEF